MELTAGGRVRRFALRLPRSRSSGGIPLVIVLHGNHPDATGLMMREWTTFDEQADAFGFAVAYPDGVGGCWADGRGVTAADEAGVDDVAFVDEAGLLHQLRRPAEASRQNLKGRSDARHHRNPGGTEV